MIQSQCRRTARTLVLAAAAALAPRRVQQFSQDRHPRRRKPPVGSAAPSAAASVLTIKDLSFSALTVKAGDSISIVNADSTDHTVTADDGVRSTFAAPAGKTVSVVIPKAGTYAIHCKIHASMHGSVTVT